MSSGFLYLCLVPAPWWDGEKGISPSPEFVQFIQEAIDIERRLPKKVDTERNLARYIVCCQCIAALIKANFEAVPDIAACRNLIREGKVAAIRFDTSYLDLLEDQLASLNDDEGQTDHRLGAMFFPPNKANGISDLNDYRHSITRLMQPHTHDPQVARYLAVLDLAVQHRCGIVEIHELYPTLGDVEIVPTMQMFGSHKIPTFTQLIELRAPEEPDPSDEAAVKLGSQRSQYDLMRNEIVRVLNRNQALNFSNYRNDVITEILREFVYQASKDRRPQMLRVIYGDGSQGKPIPLFSLPEPTAKRISAFEGDPPLRLALLSIRHMEMDSEVDMAWFRNSEASLRRMSYADTDEFCYQETLRQLDEITTGSPLLIHLYQTGLEPAVVGFYRGLVEYLLHVGAHSARVAVVPKYFRGARAVYRSGKIWM